ncbi:MAG: PP2C family protein-serine/threonine phosphatase [Balneolales bacterium]
MDTFERSQSHFDLKALLDTSRLLVESHDPDFVLNNLLLISMGKVMSSRAMVLLCEPGGRAYRVAKVKGKLESREGQVYSPDTEYDRSATVLRGEEIPSALRDQGIATLFNIRTSERHLGFLCLGGKISGQSLSQEETGFLESLVFMSAVAIGNSLLVKELKQTNRELDLKVQEMNTLFDLSKEFNATIDRDQVIRVFKFALLGQMLIRTFILAIKNDRGETDLIRGGNIADPQPDELNSLFGFSHTVTVVDEDLQRDYPWLARNNIEVILLLNARDNHPACIGLGKRGGGQTYEEYDFNFLISLGNLMLLSLHKTFLLDEQLEKKRIEEELNLARSIQQKLLPDPIPQVRGLDMAAINISSRQVGGDYYDIIPDGTKLYLAIADVTGKGAPASLLMANLQAMLQVLVPLDISLPEATDKMNTIIHKNTASDKFISFFWGKVDVATRTFAYVNAGHNPPYLFRAHNGTVEELSTGGILLGAMPTFSPYIEGNIQLNIGDVLVMYTDGVTEATNTVEEEYAGIRLMDCIQANMHCSAEELLKSIIRDVKDFSGDHFNDDVTLLVVKGTA